MQKILDCFTDLTGIRVAYFDDYSECITGKDKALCRFCYLIRKYPDIYNSCINCDRSAFRRAEENKGLYLYKCHMNLWEAVVPLFYGYRHAGFLMLGQVKCKEEGEDLWNKIEDRLRQFDVLAEEIAQIKEAYDIMEPMEREKIKAAALMLEIIARYIIDTDIIYIYDMQAIEKAKEYILQNYRNDISTTVISQITGLSTSYFSYLFKRETGTTVTDFINNLRIGLAKNLLRSSSFSVKEIAAQTGYKDQNYFSRIFKKYTGLSPIQFRKQSAISDV